MKTEEHQIILGGVLLAVAFFMSFLRDFFTILDDPVFAFISLIIAVIGILLLLFGLTKLTA